ncbi:MAG TPA: hypothetical protein VFP69_08490 [Streptomyces sp.]|nr:hypothetical protein [Streptomyces sp.]
MADERYRWLDRETAERLLSGEPLEAVDAAACEQAEQLADTLGALSATAPLSCEELPGEAGALAAFRKMHAEREAGIAPVGGPAEDAGPVLLGRRGAGERRRWGRPARLGLAAALAAGMLGGVAVAAGTGALPLPFRPDEPEPGTSVSVDETTEPLVTPPPDGSSHDDGRTGSPDGPSGKDDDGRGEDDDPDGTASGGSAWEQARQLAAACRDVRDGNELDAERRHALESAAGGAAKVWKYCESVLAGSEDEDGPGTGHGTGPGPGGSAASGGQGGAGKGKGRDQDQDQDEDQDEQDEQDGSGDQGDARDQDGSGDQDDSGGQDAGKTAGRGTAGRGAAGGGSAGRGGDHADNAAAPRPAHLAPPPAASGKPPGTAEPGDGTGTGTGPGTETGTGSGTSTDDAPGSEV